MITSDSLAPAQPIARTIQALCRGILVAQQQLDADYAKRLDEFGIVTQLAAGSGFESLAKSLEPAPIVMTATEIECSFVFAKSTEREFSVRVMNAAWVSRFQAASSARHSLRFEVKRAPLSPAKANTGTNSPI